MSKKTPQKLANLKEDLKVRPNTGLPADFIQDHMVVCTGEHPDELVEAILSAFPGRRPKYHAYRCYRAWKFSKPAITVVLSGIGTGCLEPLMFELLDHQHLGDRVPKRLVMIGTAGYLADSGFGQVYLVDGAYPVGCGVRLDASELPLRPKFDGLEKTLLPRAEEISTDYYYGCTPAQDDLRKMRAKLLNRDLAAGIQEYWKPGRLISMESAQFYHFAKIYGSDSTQYVALRGVANLADQFEMQGEYSAQVLNDALFTAVRLLSS